MPLSFSLCLPRPPSFSWVISLSYVCPSLYVCVPPLFVSDSFSREIRDAYLVPLFSTSRGSAELHRAAMALVVESHIHSSCAHHTPDQCFEGPVCRIKAMAAPVHQAPVHWAMREPEASNCNPVIDCLIDRLTLPNA